MSELAVALFLAALIAPPSTPSAMGTQVPAAARAAVVAGPAAGVTRTERAVPDAERKVAPGDSAKQNVKPPAPARTRAASK